MRILIASCLAALVTGMGFNASAYTAQEAFDQCEDFKLQWQSDRAYLDLFFGHVFAVNFALFKPTN